MQSGSRDRSPVSRGGGEVPASAHGREASQGESLRELGRVTAELLHDLGGVLSVLESRVSLARGEAALGRAPSAELHRIQKDTRELRRMVVDVLDELRHASRSPDMAMPVEPLLEETVNRWLSAAPPVSPSLRSTLPEGASIAGPRTFFTRTLGNLLRNAGRHARSRIQVTARTLPEEGLLEILVEDDGQGVSEGIRSRIFEPLVAGTDQGTGLGLSFSQWAVERMGGTLELLDDGELGGATFRLRLPLASPGATPYLTRRPLPDELAALSGLRVVLVEDDPSLLRVLRRRLEGEGADVLTPAIPSGEELGRMVRDIEAWQPDLLLVDFDLGGLSGVEVYGAVTARSPELAGCVCFLTGGAAPSDAPPDAPVLNKLEEWEELVTRILALHARQRSTSATTIAQPPHRSPDS